MKNKLVVNLVVFLLVVLVLSGCSQEAPVSNDEENTEETTPVENQEEAAPIEKEDELAEIRVIAEILNIRSDSTINSEVIGQLKKDQVVKPLAVKVSDERNWYQVAIDGNSGWIAGWYTLNNEDYENKVFKSHLLPAFEGKLPSVKGTLKMTYDEVVSLYGDDLEAMNYLGGKSLYNKRLAFQFGEEGLAFINLRPEVTVYGIAPGSTLEEVKSILGTPDQEYTIDDPENYGIFEDGASVIVYLTGAYGVEFVFNDGVELTSVQLDNYNPNIGSTESTESTDSTDSTESTETSFESIYMTEDIYNAILAFQQNPTEVYAKDALKVFEAKVFEMNDIMKNFDLPTTPDYLGTYSYKDIGYYYPSIDTEKNQINVYGMSKTREAILTTLGESEIFMPAVISYASEGNVQSNQIAYTLPEALIEPIQDMYKKQGKSLDSLSETLAPFYLPTETFNGQGKYTQSETVDYPKVYIKDFDALKMFDGAEIWKVEVIYPLNVVNEFFLEDLSEDEEAADESAVVNETLTRFSNETINGEMLSYNQLTMAVIEGYSGKNISLLDEKYIINDAYPEGDWLQYSVAVMGTIRNVKLMTQRSMSEEFIIKNIDAEVTDTLLKIRSAFPTDFSVDRLEFNDEQGNKHSVPVETMSDNITIVTATQDSNSKAVGTKGSLTTIVVKDPNKKSVSEEGFVSETISTKLIDYSENIVTLFPWGYAGANASLMSNQAIKLQQGSDHVSLSVVGKLENVEVIQRSSGSHGSSDIVNPIEPTTFENTVVNFTYKYNGMFGDTVSIIVKGDVVYDNGHIESIEIPLIKPEQPAYGQYIKQLPKVLPF